METNNLKNPIGSFCADTFGFYCGCFQPENEMYREDCYWFHEEHDMGARIPTCAKTKDYIIESCSKDCKNYISNTRVSELANKYLEGRNYGYMAAGETKD